jgi:hypothetical protein
VEAGAEHLDDLRRVARHGRKAHPLETEERRHMTTIRGGRKMPAVETLEPGVLDNKRGMGVYVVKGSAAKPVKLESIGGNWTVSQLSLTKPEAAQLKKAISRELKLKKPLDDKFEQPLQGGSFDANGKEVTELVLPKKPGMFALWGVYAGISDSPLMVVGRVNGGKKPNADVLTLTREDAASLLKSL